MPALSATRPSYESILVMYASLAQPVDATRTQASCIELSAFDTPLPPYSAVIHHCCDH